MYDFRNESLISWFIDELIGGPEGMGSPLIDGMYIDDVAGLGSPGTPDASPVFKQSGLSAAEAAKWNAGQRRAGASTHRAHAHHRRRPAGAACAEPPLVPRASAAPLKRTRLPGQVVVFGITTDMCVSTTVRVGHNLGFDMAVVSDACATFDQTSPDGEPIAAALLHQVHLTTLNTEFAVALRTADVQAMVQATLGPPPAAS